MSTSRTRVPAKIIACDVGIERDHGDFLTLLATFDYGATCQGLGLAVDGEFIRRFLLAVGCSQIDACVGQVVLVDSDWGRVYGIYPMPFNESKCRGFDIESWANIANKQNTILKEQKLDWYSLQKQEEEEEYLRDRI